MVYRRGGVSPPAAKNNKFYENIPSIFVGVGVKRRLANYNIICTNKTGGASPSPTDRGDLIANSSFALDRGRRPLPLGVVLAKKIKSLHLCKLFNFTILICGNPLFPAGVPRLVFVVISCFECLHIDIKHICSLCRYNFLQGIYNAFS